MKTAIGEIKKKYLMELRRNWISQEKNSEVECIAIDISQMREKTDLKRKQKNISSVSCAHFQGAIYAFNRSSILLIHTKKL